MLLRHKNLPAALLADEIFLPWLGKQMGRDSLPLFQCYHGGTKPSCELSKGQGMEGPCIQTFASNSAGPGHAARAGRTCCSCWVPHGVRADVGPSPRPGSSRASPPGLFSHHSDGAACVDAVLVHLMVTSGSQGPGLQETSPAHWSPRTGDT